MRRYIIFPVCFATYGIFVLLLATSNDLYCLTKLDGNSIHNSIQHSVEFDTKIAKHHSRMPASDPPSEPVRVCSSKERLEHIRETCSGGSLDSWLETLSDHQLRRVTKDWVTDENHKVLACLHFKVSTATWDVIFCNNSLKQPLPHDHTMDWKEWKACLADHNVFHLGDKRFSRQDIIERIKSYYKFMVVRHPLDRLLSVYLDKLGDSNPWYPQHLGSVILRQYRRWLAESIKSAGKGVYFQEFIQYILDGGRDEHWQGPYSDQCQPCFVDYDAIVKLETFSADILPIIETLAGRSKDTITNSYGKSHWNKQFVKVLEQYGDITGKQLHMISEMYKLDFMQYGYGFEWQNKSLAISCKMKSASDICC